MAIITISRQAASFGDEIAKSVSQQLQYSYIDKIRISDAMAEQGLPPADFEKFDEKKPTIWQSMSNQKNRFTFLLGAAVYEFAHGGNVVLLGRGGQILLKDVPGTVHVRIIAPFGDRLQRLTAEEGCEEKKAERLLSKKDRDSSGFIRAFFDINWNDETLYDLLLNTRTMSVDTAVSLIQRAVSSQEFGQTAQEGAISLEDMALEQKIKAALVGFSDIELAGVNVAKGVAILTGLVNSSETVKRCEKSVSKIKGVKKVQADLQVVPFTGR